ncbi:histidine kinase N-terminal 7TM domain-containing diguanylate cyclase [Syntrophomonas palmitatica]|uniref:histidine kinase N-terminal 7TM domain-containing diguanylate cyclase n=1 Tax=Syntrophomonas palmitatica TaxID=402877 RepID=UPI0006CFB3A8|nr:histidine kinase N-terminal 7TM domain-containing protein [Syntrophomonas palmitatica]
MAQITTAYVLLLLSCLNAVMFLYIVFNRHKRPLARGLALVGLLILEWSVSVTLRSFAADPNIAVIFHELKFVGSALLPVVILWIVMNYTGLGRLIQTKQIALLSVIPILTIFFSQTNPWHHLFRKSFQIIYQPDGAFYIHAYNNYWFYVFAIFNYSVLTASMVLLVRNYFKSSQNRLQTTIFLIAIAFPFITNIIDLRGWIQAYDLTICALTVSLAFFLYGVFFYSAYDLVPLARIKLVDSLPNLIFIYDNEYRLTDANHAAIELMGTGIKEILGRKRENLMQLLPIHPIQTDDYTYWFTDFPARKEQVMSLESQIVSETNGKAIAYIDIFTDITPMEKAKRKIEKIANVDNLTGLYNRNFFEHTMHCLDQQGTAPVALILGDVDGLKKINDTFGHAAGDEMIRQAARAMKNAVRSDDVVARIGGDEFIIFLENITQNDVERVIETIKENCHQKMIENTVLSICLGYAIRADNTQSMEDVFRLADKNMYSHKRSLHEMLP